MKKEFGFTKGSIVCLAPKCYSLHDEDSNTVKRAMKGLSQDNDVGHKVFLETLYSEPSDKVLDINQCTLQMNRKTGS